MTQPEQSGSSLVSKFPNLETSDSLPMTPEEIADFNAVGRLTLQILELNQRSMAHWRRFCESRDRRGAKEGSRS